MVIRFGCLVDYWKKKKSWAGWLVFLFWVCFFRVGVFLFLGFSNMFHSGMYVGVLRDTKGRGALV